MMYNCDVLDLRVCEIVDDIKKQFFEDRFDKSQDVLRSRTFVLRLGDYQSITD